MQILIDLHYVDPNGPQDDKAQEESNRDYVVALLETLVDKGFRVPSLYGRLIFDHAKKEAIDCGEHGAYVPKKHLKAAASSVVYGRGEMLIVFVEEKYLLFVDTYFPSTHFCHQRKVRPISPKAAYEHIEDLIVHQNQEVLNALYLESFRELYGDVEAVPTLHDPLSGKPTPPLTSGYGVASPSEIKEA